MDSPQNMFCFCHFHNKTFLKCIFVSWVYSGEERVIIGKRDGNKTKNNQNFQTCFPNTLPNRFYID